jgi:hypothetical protein
MDIFIESPWPFLLIGIVLEAVLGVLLLQTGRGKLLWAMIGVGVFTLLGLVAERLIVTDRELVEATLDKAARAVENGDTDKLIECISDSKSDEWIRDKARKAMADYKVDSVWIRNLEITVNNLTSPPTAKAKFTAVGQGQDRKGVIPYRAYSEPVVVELKKKGDRWLVTGLSGENYLSR